MDAVTKYDISNLPAIFTEIFLTASTMKRRVSSRNDTVVPARAPRLVSRTKRKNKIGTRKTEIILYLYIYTYITINIILSPYIRGPFTAVAGGERPIARRRACPAHRRTPPPTCPLRQ